MQTKSTLIIIENLWALVSLIILTIEKYAIEVRHGRSKWCSFIPHKPTFLEGNRQIVLSHTSQHWQCEISCYNKT